MPTTITLALLAVLLTVGTPMVLPAWTALRQVPGAGLLLWQGSALGGLSAIALVPVVAAEEFGQRNIGVPPRVLVLVALGGSVMLVIRLAIAAHRVGTDLRTLRARHRQSVDLLDPRHNPGDRLRVIDAGGPVAWCLPGREARIVMSRVALEELSDSEVHAIYCHERAHLRRRHDLLMEFFTVADSAVPARLRHPGALAEVALLVEILADRAAAREVGRLPMGRALATVALGTPDGVPPASAEAAEAPSCDEAVTIGQGRAPTNAVIRLDALRTERPRRVFEGLIVLLALVAAVFPTVLAVADLVQAAGRL